VKKRGYVVFFGNASGPVPPIDPLILTQKGMLFNINYRINIYDKTKVRRLYSK
jgi:NADPH:quinone reductase